MADRRNLSIPINLVFLAGLLAASHLATVMAPPQQQQQQVMARAEMTATVKPVDNLSDGAPVVKLTAVAMPALPDIRLPEMPVTDGFVKNAKAPPIPAPAVTAKPVSPPQTPMIPQPASSTPPGQPLWRTAASGPNPSNPPSIVPMETSSLALNPVLTLSPKSRSVAMVRTLMPFSQTHEWAPVSDVGSDAMPIPSLTPLAPNRPRSRDAMPAALPVGDPVVLSSAQDQLDLVTLRPVKTSEPPQFVKPRAFDLQTADQLMDNAAQKLSLEFLWPADRRDHSRIYSRLTECLGVEIGVINGKGKVYVGTGGGRVFNAALHSPFMRLVDQPVDPRERRNIKRIRTGLQITATDGTAVRVFRREHDIRLLAALNRAFGGLPTSGKVTAEYQIEAGALYLGKLKLNGRTHDGRVRLDDDTCI